MLENQQLTKSSCASDETRTRTAISGQGILSPSCLPFHHQGFRFEGNKDTNNI